MEFILVQRSEPIFSIILERVYYLFSYSLIREEFPLSENRYALPLICS